VTGGLVFLSSWWEGFSLVLRFFQEWVCVLSICLATLLLYPLFLAVKNKKIFLSRLLAGATVLLILAGWAYMEFPVVIHLQDGPLTFYSAQAPAATLSQLLLALSAGVLLIFPALGYLFYTFKRP